MGLTHRPERPGWKCRGCGEPYPCPTEKRDLITEYAGARTTLALYLATHHADAITDLSGTTENLHQRFFAWTHGYDRPA